VPRNNGLGTVGSPCIPLLTNTAPHCRTIAAGQPAPQPCRHPLKNDMHENVACWQPQPAICLGRPCYVMHEHRTSDMQCPVLLRAACASIDAHVAPLQDVPCQAHAALVHGHHDSDVDLLLCRGVLPWPALRCTQHQANSLPCAPGLRSLGASTLPNRPRQPGPLLDRFPACKPQERNQTGVL
jgi:hypothetical protein